MDFWQNGLFNVFEDGSQGVEIKGRTFSNVKYKNI